MSFQQRLSITLVAIARIWRIIVSLWTVWLGFKHILGLPGDIDDAQQWQYLLKRWGMWDTLIDPRPWVFFVALGLTLWAWDVPQRIISRWRKPKLQFDLGGDPSIEKRTLDPTATYWVFDPVTILQKPGKGRENLNLDIELRIQPDPDTWLRFKRVRDPDGLPDPIVAQPGVAMKGRLAFKVPNRDLQREIDTSQTPYPHIELPCALFTTDIATGQLIRMDRFSENLVKMNLLVEGFGGGPPVVHS